MKRALRAAGVIAAASLAIATCGDSGSAATRTANMPPLRTSSISAESRPTRPENATRLAYLSDTFANTVTVFGRNGAVLRQITGLDGPEGLFVDSHQHLWVTNTFVGKILEFARGGTRLLKTLDDTFGSDYNLADDVTMCPDGTVYVSNALDFSMNPGGIEVYEDGDTEPTRTLGFQTEEINSSVTCDRDGNVFTTMTLGDSVANVAIEFPHGRQDHAKVLPIALREAGTIRVDPAGDLLIADHGNYSICEYTRTGKATGHCISTGDGGAGDLRMFDVSSDGRTIGGGSTKVAGAASLAFPSGLPGQLYIEPGASYPNGFAFDPPVSR